MTNIGEAFGIPKQPTEPTTEVVAFTTQTNNDDFDVAKASIKSLIKKGADSLEDLLIIAKDTEHPRAYEVAANFIKTLVDANKELTDISLKQNKGESNSASEARSVHNHLHISASDLLKMIKNGSNE